MRLPTMHLLLPLLLAYLTPTAPFAMTRSVPRPAARRRTAGAAPPSMVALGRPGSPWTLAGPRVESMMEGGHRIDFLMESLHLTKRRCSGGISVRASPESIWDVITAYERMPDVIPNIISNIVTRDAAGLRGVRIDQEALLSRKMNLRTSMTLEAVEERDRWTLTLHRLSGHGFLSFEGTYQLEPRADGTTYLSYVVELVPCPIFPLPLVERKIRKEVPKMLSAVAEVARTEGVQRSIWCV